MTNEKTVAILEKTKNAVQMGISEQSLNNEFVHAVKIDDEAYVVHIEKYVPASEFVEKHISLLTNS